MNNEILTYTEAVQNSPYLKDCTNETIFSMNGNPMHRGYYNLIVSIRDVKLYDRGLRPNRSWKISHVKKYFGIKGNVGNIITQLARLQEEYIALAEMENE
jgi:hypothetical protein